MDTNKVKDAARKAGGTVLVVAGIGAGVWFSLILADILTFVWVYSSVSSVMDSYNMSEYIGKIIAAGFAALVGYTINTILLNIIKRNKKWVPMLAGVMVAWFVVMYFVSSPYTSGLFNPFSGKAQAVYLRMPDGSIKSFPKGLKFDPATGKELKAFDSATAEEYQKQQNTPKPPSSSKNGDGVLLTGFLDNLEIRIDKVQVAPDRTILHFSAGPSTKDGTVYKPSSIYLTNENGKVFDLISSDIPYQSEMVAPFFYLEIHKIKAGEIYHYTMTFGNLSGGSGLNLHYDQTRTTGSEVDLGGLLAHAEKISAISPPPALPPPVEVAKTLIEAVSTEPNIGADSTTYVLKLHEGFKNIKINEIFTKKVKVDRYRRPEQVVGLAGWNLNVGECTGYTMPKYASEEVELIFFRLPQKLYLYPGEVGMIYQAMGIEPDPYALAALNEQDHSFVEKYPSMTEWFATIGDVNTLKYGTLDATQNANGTYRHLKFFVRPDLKKEEIFKTSVYCGSFTLGWAYKYDKIDWWYTGVRK